MQFLLLSSMLLLFKMGLRPELFYLEREWFGLPLAVGLQLINSPLRLPVITSTWRQRSIFLRQDVDKDYDKLLVVTFSDASRNQTKLASGCTGSRLWTNSTDLNQVTKRSRLSPLAVWPWPRSITQSNRSWITTFLTWPKTNGKLGFYDSRTDSTKIMCQYQPDVLRLLSALHVDLVGM